MLSAEDEARIWPQMIPRHLRPPVDFLPMGDSSIDIDKLTRYYQKEIAKAFGIPIELLPLPSEKLDESMPNSQTKPALQ